MKPSGDTKKCLPLQVLYQISVLKSLPIEIQKLTQEYMKPRSC